MSQYFLSLRKILSHEFLTKQFDYDYYCHLVDGLAEENNL